MLGRRSFLGSLGILAFGAAVRLPRRGPLPTSVPGTLDRIGLQLYTVRQAMGENFEGTLERVAAIGYREVEFAGYFDHRPSAVRAALQRYGLAAPSAHLSFDALGANWGRTLQEAGEIGHRYVVVPAIPEEWRTVDGYRRIAELFNRAGEEANAHGITFAYHNHDFDFARLGGRILYDVLLSETDPKLVAFEMDLYWITKAGQDPLAYFARWPGRFRMVHVKDSTGAPRHEMTDVGRGTIDWRRIFARREQAGIRHFFVEHDQPADAFASIRASYQYLARLTF
jgi:sugar phosphate isomerase/epimerase